VATTTTLYATGATAATGTGLTWTTPTNATGSTASTYAIWTSTTASVTTTLDLTGYDFSSQFVAGSTVDSVTATVKHYESGTATTVVTALTAQLFSGATAIGSPTTLTRSTTTTNSQSITFSGANAPTEAQLASPLTLRISGTRANSTTTYTVNVDYAGLAVNYTTPVTLPYTETFTGANGTAWPTTFSTTGGTTTNYINGNQGMFSAGSAWAVQRAYLAGVPASADTEVYLELTATAGGSAYWFSTIAQAPSLAANSADAGLPQYGYSAGFGADGTCWVTRIPNGTTKTDLFSGTLPGGAPAAGVAQGFRMRVQNGVVQARLWPLSQSEPTSWSFSATDPTPLTTAGRPMVALAGGATTTILAIDNLTYSIPSSTPDVPRQVSKTAWVTTPGGKAVSRYVITTATGTNREAYLYTTADRLPGTTTELAIFNHGMDTQNQGAGGSASPFLEDSTQTGPQPLAQRLIDLGYTVIVPTYGNTHGNDDNQARFAAAYAYMAANWTVTNTVLVGFSMGGDTTLINLHRQTVPAIKIAYIVAGLTDFVAIAGPSGNDVGYTGAALYTAYGTTQAGLQAATVNYDPMQQAASKWAGMRIRMAVSTQDAIITPALQGTPFRDKAISGGATVVYNQTTGAHSTPAQWEDAATVAAWLDAAAAGLSGSGTLTATGTPAAVRTAALSGNGTLTATTTQSTTTAATLSGSGTLTATTVIGGQATANLSGAGQLTATTAIALTAAANLNAAGQLTALTTVTLTRTANLSGSGQLTGSGGAGINRTAGLSGSGTLTVITEIAPGGSARDVTVVLGKVLRTSFTAGSPLRASLIIGRRE
jgi:hypothetical protein